MASTAGTPTRGPRRILQACETCRRKKTRCPGERPRCSNCTRLRQHCRYPYSSPEISDSGGNTTQGSIQSLEARLAQLEDKLDLVLDRPQISPRQAETPHTVGTDGPAAATNLSPAVSQQPPHTSHSSLLPSREVIAKAIEIYFLCGHRQPVWLFEPPSKLSPDCSEELILTVLGLSVQYAQDEFAGAQLQTPSAYNDAARVLIMLKVANSTIDLATLQSLCLLAFSNLVCGDVQLASFHVTMANNLLQCSGLDTHASDLRANFLEEQRRVYWSVQTLSVLCGLPVKIPTTLDFKSPRFLVMEETPRRTSGRAPLLPFDPPNSRGERSLGIWAHSVRSATLWGMVRVYIWRCAEGQAKAPWQPDSDYVAINAQLLDMECAFPTSSRFDSARFTERPLEELLRNRDFWLPWLKIQITYHTLHAVLNHPFLYSSRVSKPKPGPNAFWKTSTDLALVHSTWISRLLGMAVKKEFPLVDPFFAYAAAVAITLHIYWSRAADPKIRTPAEKNLELCRSFIVELGTRWPLCQTIAEDVDNLTRLCSQENEPPEDSSTAISGRISLMWKILDFASIQRSRSPTEQRLFQASWDADLLSRASSHEQMALEDPEVDDPPGDFQTSVGSYAVPPDWFSPPGVNSASASKPNDENGRPVDPENVAVDVPVGAAGQDAHHRLPGSASWTWDPSDANVTYDPFAQLYNRGVPDSGWWDYGNL